MPEFFSLKPPPKRKAEELVKELKEYSKLRPFLTFNFPINKDRKKTLEMIKSEKVDPELFIELLESNDFVVRLAMFYLLRNIRNLPEQERKKIVEKALPVLEKLAEDENILVRGQTIQALGKLGEKALPLLKKLSKDKDSWVREQAAIALGNVGEKALPLLKKLAKDEDSWVREQVARALGKLGKIALPVLKKLAKDKHGLVRGQAALALGNLGKIALPVLKKLAKDEDFIVRGQAALALGNLGKIDPHLLEEIVLPLLVRLAEDESGWVRRQVALALGNLGKIDPHLLEEIVLPLLVRLAEDESGWVRRQAILALDKIKGKLKSKLWLLATKKPLFATPYTKELAERILEIQKIVKEMKDKFGDRFIGIVIFGSTAKGYFTPASDLDWGIIAKDKEVSKYFKERTQELDLYLCKEHYVEVDENYIAKTNIEILFYGLFFGDRKKLYEIQKNTLESIDPKKYPQEWDRIRKIIMGYELDYLLKAAERFGIEDEEVERIRVFSALLRVPPTYDEALEIVRRRAGLSSSA